MAGIAILGFAYVLSQFYRSFLAVLTPVLSAELGMDASTLSFASGAWFATFALSQFPVGIWLDKFGPRHTASFLHGIFGAGGALLFATATGPNQIIVAMAMIGIGCSPVLMAAYIIFARNFSIPMFATLSSSFIAVGMVGSVAGAEPLAGAVEIYGWRQVGTSLAIISLVTSILIFSILKNPRKIATPEKSSYFALLKIRQLWPLFPLIACSYAIPASIRGLWAGPYLDEVYQLNSLEIGRIVLFVTFAQIIGTVIYGPLDRLFNTRKWVVVVGNSAMLCCCVWLAMNPSATLFCVASALVIIGFFGSASAVQAAHGKSFIPGHMIGRGMTLLNFFSIGGVAVMQFSSGIVARGWESSNDPAASFGALFTFYALVLASAITLYLLSKDAKPRPIVAEKS